MTPNELRDWLKEEQSQSSGWGAESGETVGHERCASLPIPHLPASPHNHIYQINISLLTIMDSGRKIVSILEHNPDKDPDSYRDEDIEHMRRVVAYCKRHLAQEEKAKQDTESKSYKSLKNWGHDPLKN